MSLQNPEVSTNLELSAFDQDVVQLASLAHEGWRSTRKLMPDGSRDPRPKPTTDETWIAAHGDKILLIDGQVMVDIANMGYTDLPADYQAENKASATVALGEAYRAGYYGEGKYDSRSFLFFEHVIDSASDIIHIRWLDRNAQWAPEAQRLPFASLSEEEQKKDKEIYTGAAAIVNERIADGSFTVPESMIFDWYVKDIEHLKRISKDDLNYGWLLQVGETYLMEGGWVWLDLDVFDAEPGRLHLHGTYPLDPVTKLVRGLTNTRPDAAEDGLRNLTVAKVSGLHIKNFLAKISMLDHPQRIEQDASAAS